MSEETKAIEKIFSSWSSMWEKSFDSFDEDIKKSWAESTKMLMTANDDLKKKTISTTIKGQNNSDYYKTDITLEGDIISEFPEKRPDENDIYWKWHTDIIERILNERKELLLKAIDSAGFALTKIMNPISFSTVDILKLAELFKKT